MVTPPEPDAGGGYVQTIPAGSLFSKPRKEAPVVTSVPAGAQLWATKINVTGKWVKVRTAKGHVGWVPVKIVDDAQEILSTLPRSIRCPRSRTDPRPIPSCSPAPS